MNRGVRGRGWNVLYSAGRGRCRCILLWIVCMLGRGGGGLGGCENYPEESREVDLVD